MSSFVSEFSIICRYRTEKMWQYILRGHLDIDMAHLFFSWMKMKTFSEELFDLAVNLGHKEYSQSRLCCFYYCCAKSDSEILYVRGCSSLSVIIRRIDRCYENRQLFLCTFGKLNQFLQGALTWSVLCYCGAVRQVITSQAMLLHFKPK